MDQWPSVIIDDEKESISVDAADYINDIRSRSKSSDESANVFTYPYIHLPEFVNKRQSRAGPIRLITADQQLPEPIPIVAPAEPVIITDPLKFKRFRVEAQFSATN